LLPLDHARHLNRAPLAVAACSRNAASVQARCDGPQ